MTSSDTEDTVGNFVEQKRDAMSRTDVSASEHTRFIEDGEGETENSEAIQERSSWVDGVNERNMEEGGSRVRVVPAQGKCVRCAQRCEKMFSICLTSYHPLPPAPTWSDRCMFAVRCPPHGRVAQTLTLVMMAVLGWAALWAITKDDALPGGNLFALTVLLVLCVIGGRLIQRIKLPPLLGMLIVGILLRNVPGIMVGSWIDPVWASSIRLVALTVILIRAGLGLDPVQLRRLSWTVLLLAFLPCVVEASTLAVVIHFLLDFPWLWGFMLGFVLAAVSPAVVVPSMLWLQEVGLGVDQGIPTLVIASGSVDDVIAITGFAVCLGITFTTGNLVFTIFRGPLELLMGVAGGTLAGIFLWYFPSTDQKGVPRVRVWMVLGTGLLMTFGSRTAGYAGSGALGCLVMAFVAGFRWKMDKEAVEAMMSDLWGVAQPFLFGLIGAEVDVLKIQPQTIGLGVAAIVIGSLVRMVASGVAVSGAGFTWKERLFVAIAWLPKATVQAAIGSTALDTARELTPQDTTNEKLGIQLLTIAVLVILITAPLGSALISLTARHLLRKSMREDLDRDSAIEMNNIGECAQEDDIELQAHPAEGQEQVSVQGKCDHNESV
ncbi:sodium/hydrogen exchanger 9B2-like isoform X1 [Branchiostoma lanceolatum]|uniref:sodium/hydrogen exchanger 9B2-like isoform X1 n=1 Tax=Branchiostoma lanceolatum TaxID=7740 RepID=UPI0034553AFE